MAASETTKRFFLILLAVGLLVIFSVTGSMAMFFDDLFAGDADKTVATFNVGDDERIITAAEYQNARLYHQLQERMPSLATGTRSGQEAWVVHQILVELADEHGIAVSDAELQAYLSMLLTQARGAGAGYEDIWRSRGFASAPSFEAAVREVLRVRRVREMLASGAVPTSKDVIEWWSEQYQEMRLQYAYFTADNFVDAAAAEEPDEDTLKEFFDNGLTSAQKRELEAEEYVSFEMVLISASDVNQNKISEWFVYEEPDEETLRGFYQVHRFDLFLRKLDPDQPLDPNLDPVLSWEEVENDIGTIYKLMEAGRQLQTRTADIGETPLNEWALAQNVGYFRYPTTFRSKLPNMELIGSNKLDKLFQTPINTFMDDVLFNSENNGVFLARPYEIKERSSQGLEDTREQVLEFWREKRALELAEEAANAFVEGLPEPQDHVEGDPIGLPLDAFEQLVSEAGVDMQTLDWISGNPRPTVDPKWGKDERILPWFRANVARDLEEMIDEQIIGPLEHPTARTFVVARLDGRRNADPLSIWPGELDQARRSAQFEYSRRFFDESLSFEGMQAAYGIEWAQTDTPE